MDSLLKIIGKILIDKIKILSSNKNCIEIN